MTYKSTDELKRELEESQDECARYRRQLQRAVDRLAELGVIDNIPHTKYLIVSGRVEL